MSRSASVHNGIAVDGELFRMKTMASKVGLIKDFSLGVSFLVSADQLDVIQKLYLVKKQTVL